MRSFSYILYYPSVAVRAMDIESSEVRWSGQAMLNKPLMDSFDPIALNTDESRIRTRYLFHRARI